ncbi:MAG TPA: hypothetical protein VGM63_23955 [Mucilaginibacter sp.]
MDSEFLTFQQFNDPALAEDLIDLLVKNNISYLVEEDIMNVAVNPLTAINNELSKVYYVKIHPDDFTKVTQLLKERDDQYVDEVEADHYLFGFTNEELLEVLEKEDEWSSFDYELAKKILNERGITVDLKKLAALNESRLEELRQPEKSQTFLVFLGYLFALLGGVAGIFIGWHFFSHKKTLPNGERLYGYNETDRKHGKIIFYLAICCFVICVVLKFIITNRQN